MTEPDHYKNTAAIQASLKKRYARETRFKWYGRLAVMTGFLFLFVLLADIIGKGLPAFTQHFISIDLTLDAATLGVSSTPDETELFAADFGAVIKRGLRDTFPEVSGPSSRSSWPD